MQSRHNHGQPVFPPWRNVSSLLSPVLRMFFLLLDANRQVRCIFISILGIHARKSQPTKRSHDLNSPLCTFAGHRPIGRQLLPPRVHKTRLFLCFSVFSQLVFFASSSPPNLDPNLDAMLSLLAGSLHSLLVSSLLRFVVFSLILSFRLSLELSPPCLTLCNTRP